MTAAAVILAGGKGTRSADPARAKLAQEVGGHSLMEWHLLLLEGSEIDEAIVVAGHLGDQVQSLCDAIGHHGVSVRVIHEEQQRGTVAALRLAADAVVADEFLVILGDILMALPLDQLLEEWRASGASVAVAVHPSSHPEDSDAVFPSHSGRVVVVPKSEKRVHVPNMSSAGLFAINRRGLERYGNLQDFGSDVLRRAAAEGDLFAFVTSHYLKDTGTPTRLDAARRDVESGTFEVRGRVAARPALFLDRDGVINPTDPEVYSPEAYALLPGVADAIADANRRGIPVIVVTNQPGIAKGFMTFDVHEAVRARMDRLLGASGAYVDDYYFCPHHPESGFADELPELKVACECRKPAPGMAHRAAVRHGIDLSASAMVGDTERDSGFAAAAGLHFIRVSADCGAPEGEDCYPEPADAIRRGIEVVAC